MFTFNSYNISAVEWKPVDFKIIGEQYDFIKTPITFSNGMKFNLFSFLQNSNDLSFNNKSGIFLTNLKNNNEIIIDNNLPEINQNLKKLQTILSDEEGNVYKHYSITGNLSGLIISNENFKIQDELILNFVDSYVYIEDYYGNILTNNGFGDKQLSFKGKFGDLTKYQKWEYFLSNGIIVLFEYGSNFKNAIFKNSFDRLEVKELTIDPTLNLPSDTFLFLKSYKNKKNPYNSVTDSFLVKYNANPILNENDILTIKQGNDYKQNYLGIFPYENINDDGTYNFYFHPLKNYQTAEYTYLNGKSNREYYKIYSGTNQKNGLNKIYLNYTANTLVLKFKPNAFTDFYFSPTYNSTPLKDCGLIESGASAGNYPYVSDRLYTNKQNVFEEIPELKNIVTSNNFNENKFLCSWLYGNKEEGEKIWYDRYYNPAYYTIDEALSASHMVYRNLMDKDKGLVYDVPSEIVLSPGFLYKYYHVGNKDSLNFLNDLNYKYDDGLKYSNFLNITSWTSNELYDQSPYNNNGLTFGNSGNFFGDYWKLDGTNYAIFQANDTLLEPTKFTTSLWLNFDDWSNVNGYQIFGNYYNSGFGLINDAKSIAPLITLINNASKTIYNINFNFIEASKIKTTINCDFVQRLSDMSYWVFDSANLLAIKYNVNNSLVSVGVDEKIGPKPLTNKSISKIDQVEIDSKENLYLYDNTSKIYYVFDKNGNDVSVGAASQNSKRIEIDLFDNVLDVYGNCSVVDCNNSLWQIIGSNLYKDGNVVGTVGASNQISCDVYNNIWILSNDDSYTKVDNNGNFLFRYSFSKAPLLAETNCPPSLPPEPPKLKVLDEDLPFLSTNDYRYILTYDDYQQILVTPPEEKEREPIFPITTRKRLINFVTIPSLIENKNDLTSICGLSSIQDDNMVMVDLNDNQAYIINQLGQLYLKLNLENLILEGEGVDFKTGGDFTGYQNIRKFKKTKNTTFSWKYQTAKISNSNVIYSNSNIISADVSRLSKGWHNFTFTFDSKIGTAKYYIDSILIDSKSFNVGDVIHYIYRTSLILGATTVKNTLLNNFLNINDGYRMIGSVADLKMYNIVLNKGDVENLYYSSSFAPRIKDLNWNMPVGYRNYVEEITEWFQFQLPTNKSKYYNINIHNLNVDDKLKDSIELAINNIISKLSPAHTALNKINWK